MASWINRVANYWRPTGQIETKKSRAHALISLHTTGNPVWSPRNYSAFANGFKTIRARRDRKTGVRKLITVDLWEISLVTFPMLISARVASLKTHNALALQTPAAHRAGRSFPLLRANRPETTFTKIHNHEELHA